MSYIDNYGNLVTYEENHSLELYHHGIKGQRWGRKNGPPYPLGVGDHSASEKKAGWKSSLANVAKATGHGVAATARGIGRGVRATGRGIAAVGKGTKKALIRVNLYPKKLMSDQDILDKVERLRKEDTLKRALGKMTAEDKLNQKLKNKDAIREVAKQTLSQLLPTVGRDLIITPIKDSINFKLEMKKRDDQDRRNLENERNKKAWNDIYDDARSRDMTAAEAKKLADKLASQTTDKDWDKAYKKAIKSGLSEDDARRKANDETGRLTPKANQDPNAKEREKKIWNDIYEDARAGGKSAIDARKAADSGDASIAPRKNDNNKNNNNNGGKNSFDAENAARKSIYEALVEKGVSYAEAARRAKEMDTSVTKDRSSSDGSSSSSKKDTVQNDVFKRYFEDALSKNASPREAEYLAERKQETVSTADLNAAYAENKKRDTVAKAKNTKELNAAVKPATASELSKREGKYTEKSDQERLRDAIKAELVETREAIREKGGTITSISNGVVKYTDSTGRNRVNNYADRAADAFDAEERRKEILKNRKK